MQGELVALREEGSGGQKRGSGVGFVHQQKSALAAPSGYPVSFWVFSGQQNCISKVGIEGIIGTGEGKQNQGGFFLQFLDFSTLPHCSAVYLWWLCCGEEEMLSWRLYLIGVNVNLM